MESAPQNITSQLWHFMEDVFDPEVPVLSVVDLGVVRDIEYKGKRVLVTITPTYSGCPAMNTIEMEIRFKLISEGYKDVDVFAPGEKIYSTMPGSAYGFQKGTSIASPVVAGIAALIRSYYPKLSAKQVKFSIEHSVDIDSTATVERPGSAEKVMLYNLCSSGGCVNALKAIKLASTLQPEIKETKNCSQERQRF